MRLDRASDKKHKRGIKTLINEKMKVLHDFRICDKHDPEMRAKLEREIARHPDRDAREVLDYYCRPLIQEKMSTWN